VSHGGEGGLARGEDSGLTCEACAALGRFGLAHGEGDATDAPGLGLAMAVLHVVASKLLGDEMHV
jgi:hypothetical protein